MIIVIMGRQDDIDILYTKLRLECWQSVEPRAAGGAITTCRDPGHEVITEIDEESLSAFGEQNIHIRHAGTVHEEVRSACSIRPFPHWQHGLIRAFTQLE